LLSNNKNGENILESCNTHVETFDSQILDHAQNPKVQLEILIMIHKQNKRLYNLFDNVSVASCNDSMHYAMIKLSTTINNKQNIESLPQPNATCCYLILALFIEACVACSNIGYRPLKIQKQELTPC
jgi:hypothetical protein